MNEHHDQKPQKPPVARWALVTKIVGLTLLAICILLFLSVFFIPGSVPSALADTSIELSFAAFGLTFLGLAGGARRAFARWILGFLAAFFLLPAVGLILTRIL
jgi:hypothetical protein